MAAGSIIVDLLLRTGSFQTDTDRAAKQLTKFKKEAADAGKALGDTIVKLGAITLGAGTIAGFTALIKSTIDSADHLNDLSKKTGVAVETLGGIGFAASQAGGDLEGVTAAFVKMDKSIASALGGNKNAIADFKDLGISLQDLKTQTPDQIFAKLADGFAGAEDGALKTAAATNVLGKAGADQLALLNDGGDALLKNIEYYKRYSGVTQQTAEQADQFNDTLGKLKLLSGAFGQTLASELLPTLQGMADLWLENKEKGDQFRGVATTIADAFKGIVATAGAAVIGIVGIGKAFGGLIAAVEAARKFDFKGAFNIGKETANDLANSRDSAVKFFDAVLNGQKKTDTQPTAATPKRKLTPRRDESADNEAAAALKKQLDGQIKLIQDFAKSQADALQIGNTYLEGAYQEGLLSQRDFFTQQKNIRDEALKDQLEAIDREIAAQRAFISNPLSKPADRVAAEEKIKLAVQQRAEAVTKASATEILANQASQRAAEQLADSYDNLKAQILQLSGNEFGSAQIRIAQQFRDAQRLIQQAGGDPQDAVRLQQRLEFQATSIQLQKDYNNLLADQSRREQEIYLDAANGGKGELETLAAIRDARKIAIQQLQEQAAAAAQLAAVSGTDEDKRRAADLALAVKKASAEIDPLAQRINKSLEDSLSSPLADFIKGTKSASDAFDDFARNILSSVADLAAKDIAKEIFGSANGQGGAGGFVSSLFGSGSGSSSGGLVSQIANLFGGFFAGGGDPPLNKLSVVGEKGPELFVPRTAGTILPNDLLKGNTTNQRTQNNYISVSPPAGTDRKTAMQIGADIARQLATADRRNN